MLEDDEINQTNFNRDYRLGLLVFSTSSLFLFLTSTASFASDSGVLPASNGGTDCLSSALAKPKPGSLAVIPSADQGAYGVSALGICRIAMKTGAYWVEFVCAVALIIEARMASFLTSNYFTVKKI
jgi:hypothetical protein